jgi:deoxyribodipyrimidine photo-lyase
MAYSEKGTGDQVNIFWFRRDLRLHDNAGLYYALYGDRPVLPVFIFDRNILDELEDKTDRRVEFIHGALESIQQELRKFGSTLDVRYGFPLEIFPQLLDDYAVANVFTNHDYEPYARLRDGAIAELLREYEVPFHTYKDQVIFEKNEVLKDDGNPYTVFTPYSKKWKAKLNDSYLKSYTAKNYFSNFFRHPAKEIPSLQSMRFQPAGQSFPGKEWKEDMIRRYKEQRDIPSVQGTSRLSVHLRFGTVSIRQLAREAGKLSETFLNELIWRDFYHMILWHFPKVISKSFKPEYDNIRWRNNEKEFKAWCEGQTGYPIVDAGMRELNETGYMHNRVRMIVASFLTKHLLIDWRWGEAYFAKKLLDFDLAANNGGWQWAAGCGCDAAPYFRIFNPYLQTKKFDPELKYIRKWVPEFEELTYPRPVAEHEFARKRCLEIYGKALKK